MLEIISQQPLSFVLNAQTLELLNDMGLSGKQQQRLQPFLSDEILARDAIDKKLSELFPDTDKQKATYFRSSGFESLSPTWKSTVSRSHL
ncbi:hypothetical protein QUF61_17770 [Candidatus Venteria ishoeyi]|uniref:hypothetical protein n=1 Tax=Candidatus Venteria ishoeyi TaxID=1899563 RepID=UPI0025A6296F|nr:hypothetical protein [Candidatus Venteria ishoeyi]MDM8548342.1 hypothetical protein [Candidatus Venteria ishoeyi]